MPLASEIILGILAALGIVGATAWSIVRLVFRSDERKIELRRTAAIEPETIKALRDEIAALRETCTQFDLAMEHTVQRIDERVGRLEQRAIRPASAAQPDAERVSLRRD
jgi:hypothetical protein